MENDGFHVSFHIRQLVACCSTIQVDALTSSLDTGATALHLAASSGAVEVWVLVLAFAATPSWSQQN